jgi:hypothetical protein
LSGPCREITVTAAPSFLSTAQTVTDAPPLPSTRAFCPATAMPLDKTRLSKPPKSVLSPYRLPSARRTSVLTLPSARAVSESAAQYGTTAFL